MDQIVLIAHNVRSCHNVGSLLRTCEGLAVDTVYLTGYTPYPLQLSDQRLPHEANKIHRQIQKTALGAEELIKWQQHDDVHQVISQLKNKGFCVVALEQTPNSKQLPKWHSEQKIALLVGREVEGIEKEVLDACDLSVEIPMLGRKESFNVVQATAMALYHCRFS